MALWFRDFSQIRFDNETVVLPRRQNVRFEGVNAEDTGEEIAVFLDTPDAQLGQLKAELGAEPGRTERETRSTIGHTTMLDGGGGEAFAFVDGDTTPATVVNIPTSNGRLKRVNRDPVIDLSKAGCVHGTTSDQSAAILNAINAGLDLAAEAAPNTTQRVVDIVIPPGKLYHLATPLVPPGDNTFRVRVRGGGWRCVSQAAYGNAGWAGADPGAGGSGFTIAPGVNGISLGSGGVKWLELSNLMLLGVNGGGSRVGLAETGGSSVTTIQNVGFMNLTTGLTRGCVSLPFNRDLYFVGCQLGASIGGTDQYYVNTAFQTCTTGLIVGGHNLFFGGRTLVQNCADGIQIGNACECVVFDDMWFEANTNSDITEYPGATYHSVDVRCARWASYGLGANEEPLVITQGRWNFGPLQRFGAKLDVQGGAVSYQSPDIHPDSVLSNGSFQFVGTNGGNANVSPVAGVLDFNFFLTGNTAGYAPGVLTANLAVNNPSNFPYGGSLEICFKQDGTGGRTLSFPGATLTSGYSNAGNVANAFTVIRLHRTYPIGVWVQQLQPWSLV